MNTSIEQGPDAPLSAEDVGIRRVDLDVDEKKAIRPRFESHDGVYGYNASAAHLAALASAWAYSDARMLKEQIEEVMQTRFDCTAFEAHNPTLYLDTDAYLLISRRRHPKLGAFSILVFRGTELTDIADVLADAYVELVPFPHRSTAKGRVHAGFHEGALAVWKPVQKMLTGADMGELIITGHSLGAALALVTTAQLYALGDDDPVQRVHKSLRGIYTFGQPAVGDAAFGKWLLSQCNGMIFRHVHAQDVVPFLPTGDISPDYRHLATGIWSCEREGSAWSGPSTETTFRLARHFGWVLAMAGLDFVSRRFHGRIGKLLFGRRYSLDDHSPLHYVRISKESVPADGSAFVRWPPSERAAASEPQARTQKRSASYEASPPDGGARSDAESGKTAHRS